MNKLIGKILAWSSMATWRKYVISSLFPILTFIVIILQAWLIPIEYVTISTILTFIMGLIITLITYIKIMKY